MTVKTILITLMLASFGLWAQTPPPPAPPAPSTTPSTAAPSAVRSPARAVPMAARTNAPGVGPGAPVPLGRAQQPPVPTGPPAPGAAPAGAPPGPMPAIVPSPAAASSADDTIAAKMIDFRAADLPQVLTIYAELVNRTILRATLPEQTKITLTTQTAITKAEAIEALDAVLGMNGVAMVNVGEKFVKAVPSPNAPGTAASFLKDPSGLGEIGQYVTYVMQVTNVKPSEVMPAIQSFASTVPNPILPIDSSQILVLRDFSENVKRMVEMVKRIDVVIPSEFASEVIPIKYAIASDIASVLNSLSSGGGGGAGVGGAGGMGRRGMGGMNRMGGMGGMGGMNRMGGMGGMGMGYGGMGGGYGGYSGGMTPGVTRTARPHPGWSRTPRPHPAPPAPRPPAEPASPTASATS